MKFLSLFVLFTGMAYATEALLHRTESTPTGWWWHTSKNLNDIKNFALSKGARVTDLERTPDGKFSAVYVKNSGAYNVSKWWIYAGDLNTIKQKLSEHRPARIIDIEPYVVNGKRYYATIMVANHGTHTKKWWWYVGLTSDQVREKKDLHKARIVDMESYSVSGQDRYAVVMVKREGDDNRGWWYYRNITFDSVKTYLRNNNAIILDLDRRSNGRFDVVMERKRGTGWWWNTNQTAAQVSELLAQNKARIIDLEPHTRNGKTRYMVVALDNANSLEKRVRNFYAPLAPGAKRGFYLKQIGGSTLADVRGRTKFVPASSLKALYHYSALRRVRFNQLELDTNDKSLCGPNTSGNAPNMPGTGSCPFSTPRCETTVTTQTMRTLLSRMMINSNNRATQSVREIVGQNYFNNVASGLGMTDTLIRERIGCGENVCLNAQGQERPCTSGNQVDFGYRGTPLRGNETSLRDFGLLYAAALNLNNLGEDQREEFFDIMLNETNNGWLRSVASQENNSVGLASSDLNSFRSNLQYVWKGGSYGNSNSTHYTRAGLARIPVKVGNRMVYRNFVFGAFQDAGPSGQTSQVAAVVSELLRDEIKKALNTWK